MRLAGLVASTALLFASAASAQFVPINPPGGGGGGFTALTGDVTASGSGSVASLVAAITNAISDNGTGAASTAAVLYTGLPFAGTGTTSFPLLLVQPTGGTPPTASTTWSTSGTVLGANLHTGTLGNFIDFQVDGASKFTVTSSGGIVASNGFQIPGGSLYQFNGHGALSSPAAGKIQLGASDAASPTAQFLKVQNVIAGTSNTVGQDFRIEGSQGTGTGAGGQIIIATAPAGSTGTAQNAEVTALTIDATQVATFVNEPIFSAMTATSVACVDGSKALTATCSSATPSFGATTIGGALTYGGVTLTNSVTGTGSMALATSPTLVTPSLGVTTVTGTGAASTAGMLWTGLPFLGTGTTSFPLLFSQPTGGTPPTASTTWSTAGTVLGANLHTGTFGNFIDFQVDGTSKFSVNSSGGIVAASGFQIPGGSLYQFNGRGQLSSPAAGKVQLGASDAAAPVAQFLKPQNVVAGTTDTAGQDFRIEGSQGTGTGVGGKIIIATAPAGTTGSAQNAEQNVLTFDQKSHALWASAAIPTVGTCGTGSPTVTAGSTDVAGSFTVGTSATACTLTFKQTYTTAPFCVVNDQTVMANITAFTISTTAIVLTMTSNSGNVVQYHCFGN